MNRRHLSDNSMLKYLYEISLSLNCAFGAISIAFTALPKLSYPFARIEVVLNELFKVRQTDFIRGYVAIWLPTIALALLLWFLLHTIFGRNSGAAFIAHSASGFALFFIPPVLYFCAYQRRALAFGWPYRGMPFELIIALFCLVLFLHGKWDLPAWFGGSVLIAHYIFWYWLPTGAFHAPNWQIASYAGPLGTCLGLLSSVSWGVFIARFRTPRDSSFDQLESA